jgi:hypothetical protein
MARNALAGTFPLRDKKFTLRIVDDVPAVPLPDGFAKSPYGRAT